MKNRLSKHKYFVNIKSDLFSIFLVKQYNTQKWPKNSYIFLILEPIGRFVHCKKCSPPNMANKMSLNSYLNHHLCLIFQIWLHNNDSWQKGHLIVQFCSWFHVPVSLKFNRPSHKSQNAPVPYTTMQHFVTEMCTCTSLLQNDTLWDICPLQLCGICEMGLLTIEKSKWWFISVTMAECCCSWWRHDIEIHSTLLALCEGNPPVTGGFPSQMASNAGFVLFNVSPNRCWVWC